MKINLNLLIGLSILMFIGCKKDKTEIFELNRNSMVGVWSLTGTSEQYFKDTLVFTSDLNFTLDLQENGYAIKENLIFPRIDTFSWFFQSNPNKFILISRGMSFAPINEFDFDQLQDENKHILHGSYEPSFSPTSDFVEETWILTR